VHNLLYHQVEFVGPDKSWLVFIHGAGGAIETWKYQVKAFAPHFNLLLMDLRDHGKSKNLEPEFKEYDFDVITDDVMRVLEHVGVQKAHFMSLSLGSIILQQIEVRRPDVIDRMVMAGGVFKATVKLNTFMRTAKALNYVMPYRVMYNLFSWIVLPRKNHAHSRRIFRLQSRKLSPKEYLKWVGLYKQFFKVLKRYFYRPVENISLVVMGDQDHVFFGAAKRFVQVQKNVHLVIMEGCGHVCNIESPKRFNQLALDFLNEGINGDASKMIAPV
jgi:pimeloyl-ACP methyl ester carboxylesterase